VKAVLTIAGREVKRYFVSPIAYAVAAVLYLALGLLFYRVMSVGMVTRQILPDGRMLLQTLTLLLLFITPAISMRLLAEEKGSGTIELLQTTPVSDSAIIFGKWLGAWIYMLGLLSVTLVYPILLHRVTYPGIDFGQLTAAYLGLFLMVGAMLAIGVCVSAFFRHQLAAFITHLGILQVLWVSGELVRRPGISADILQYLNFVNHYYDNFFQGIVSLSDVFYFVSLIILSLILGTLILAWGRWR
jgi:ABC-2 type transport system permease protein